MVRRGGSLLPLANPLPLAVGLKCPGKTSEKNYKMAENILRKTGIREDMSLAESPSKNDPNDLYDLITGLAFHWEEVRAAMGL